MRYEEKASRLMGFPGAMGHSLLSIDYHKLSLDPEVCR